MGHRFAARQSADRRNAKLVACERDGVGGGRMVGVTSPWGNWVRSVALALAVFLSLEFGALNVLCRNAGKAAPAASTGEWLFKATR